MFQDQAQLSSSALAAIDFSFCIERPCFGVAPAAERTTEVATFAPDLHTPVMGRKLFEGRHRVRVCSATSKSGVFARIPVHTGGAHGTLK